ncbi:inhibitor of apoptosis 1, diap1, putative, partial [Ixodes scapularis]
YSMHMESGNVHHVTFVHVDQPFTTHATSVIVDNLRNIDIQTEQRTPPTQSRSSSRSTYGTTESGGLFYPILSSSGDSNTREYEDYIDDPTRVRIASPRTTSTTTIATTPSSSPSTTSCTSSAPTPSLFIKARNVPPYSTVPHVYNCFRNMLYKNVNVKKPGFIQTNIPTCIVCKIRVANIVIIPCKHCITCFECMCILRKCITCRRKIHYTMQIFYS